MYLLDQLGQYHPFREKNEVIIKFQINQKQIAGIKPQQNTLYG